MQSSCSKTSKPPRKKPLVNKRPDEWKRNRREQRRKRRQEKENGYDVSYRS